MIYFDAAYIAKCYLNEPGSQQVISLASTVVTVSSCVTARLEVVSTFHRHLREGKLTQQQMLVTWQKFQADEQSGAWDWVPVTQSLMQVACENVRKLPGTVFLRSADALHLTCTKERGFTEIYTNDRHILVAASHFGLRAINIIP